MRLKDAGRKIDKKVKYLKRGGGGGNPLEKIVRDMRSRLISRVGKGKDHKGKGFTKYADSTIRQKEGLGRSGQVDLSETNTMLKNVAINSHRNYVDVYLGARKNIGMYHQKGTSPYTITPKAAKALHWGKNNFAKSVRHPGLPKRAWFGYTKKSRKKAEKDYKVHIKKALRK